MNRETYTDMKARPMLSNSVHKCVPFLDVHLFSTNPIRDPEILPSPCLLCSHITYSLLPETAKGLSGCCIVHMWGDPKDALILFWHFTGNIRRKATRLPELAFTEAFEMFSQGVSPFGSFWDEVLGYWKASVEYPHDKIFFLKYEDMKRDTISHVKRLAEFLGQPFTVEKEEKGIMHEILKLCVFESMSKAKVSEKGNFCERPANYRFYFRKDKVGDSKKYFTGDMMRHLDEITEEKFKGGGLTT